MISRLWKVKCSASQDAIGNINISISTAFESHPAVVFISTNSFIDRKHVVWRLKSYINNCAVNCWQETFYAFLTKERSWIRNHGQRYISSGALLFHGGASFVGPLELFHVARGHERPTWSLRSKFVAVQIIHRRKSMVLHHHYLRQFLRHDPDMCWSMARIQSGPRPSSFQSTRKEQERLGRISKGVKQHAGAYGSARDQLSHASHFLKTIQIGCVNNRWLITEHVFVQRMPCFVRSS